MQQQLSQPAGIATLTCELHDDGIWYVRDNGKLFLATARYCSCPVGLAEQTCHHMLAVRDEEAQLEANASNWNNVTEPRCPECGARLEGLQCYVGGHGYVGFLICSGDGLHPVQRVR